MSVENNNQHTTEEKKNNSSHSSNVLDMSNLLRNLFEQARTQPRRRVRIQEQQKEQSEDSENQDSEEDEDDQDLEDEDDQEEWDALGNLLDSHQKLCKAFLLLLKQRHDE
jgi:hypothetical protein